MTITYPFPIINSSSKIYHIHTKFLKSKFRLKLSITNRFSSKNKKDFLQLIGNKSKLPEYKMHSLSGKKQAKNAQ